MFSHFLFVFCHYMFVCLWLRAEESRVREESPLDLSVSVPALLRPSYRRRSREIEQSREKWSRTGGFSKVVFFALVPRFYKLETKWPLTTLLWTNLDTNERGRHCWLHCLILIICIHPCNSRIVTALSVYNDFVKKFWRDEQNCQIEATFGWENCWFYINIWFVSQNLSSKDLYIFAARILIFECHMMFN